MDLQDKSHVLETRSQCRENVALWEKDDLQSLFDIICYFNHTQLQTEITSLQHTQAQITFLKRTIPSVAWPLTSRPATNLPQHDLACGCRGYMHRHTHSLFPSRTRACTHTHTYTQIWMLSPCLSLSFLWGFFPTFKCTIFKNESSYSCFVLLKESFSQCCSTV